MTVDVWKSKLNECEAALMLLVDQEMKDKGYEIKHGIYVLHYNFYDHDCMISFDVMSRKWISALIHCVEPITVENDDKKNPWGYFAPPSKEPMKGLQKYATAFDNNEISQLVPKLKPPSDLPKNVTKFYPNVPDPDDQDPVEQLEQLEHMESCVSKKQFVLMQFIKIYIVLQQQFKLNLFTSGELIKTMEIALKGEKVLLTPKLIRDLQIPKKIQYYFRKYGEIYK